MPQWNVGLIHILLEKSAWVPCGGLVLRVRLQSWRSATGANPTPLILCPVIHCSYVSMSCLVYLSLHLDHPFGLETWESTENKNQEKGPFFPLLPRPQKIETSC